MMTTVTNSGKGVSPNRIFNLLILLLVLQPISNFEFRCPEPSQWNLRAVAICNGSVSTYVCLYDDNNQQYRERCESKPDLQRAGFKDVILGGLQRKQCNTERYQPFKFWTNGSSDCIYEKSLCEEEGQITYNNGNTTSDRCCRCDYTKGYTYVSKPENPCFCVATKEDCSCFKTKCDIGFVLGPDYECVNFTSWSGNFKCPDIKHTSSDLLPTDARVTLLTDSNISDEISTSSTLTGMLSLVMICLSITVMVVTYCIRKKKEKLIGDPSNESTQNRYARLARVLNLLSKLAREVIKSKIPPDTLYNQIKMTRKTNPKKIDSILTQEQFVSLNRNTYDNLEFTDVYKLLRVFGYLGEPAKGWGWQPTESDTEISDDIERLRRLRNSVVNKHINDISQAKFDQHFSDFTTVAKRVDKYLGKKNGKGFATELKEIKTCMPDLTQVKNNSLDTEDIKYRFTEGKYHIHFGRTVENLIDKVGAEPAKDEKIKVKIVLENVEDEEEKTRQLNNFKQQINDGQYRIEFVKAETGSVILFANILDTIICSGNFYSELGLFLEHILGYVCSGQSANQHINAIILHEDDCSELDFAIEDEESLNTCFEETPVDPKSIRLEVNVNTELFQSVELLQSEVANFMNRASKTNGAGGGSHASAILTTHVSVDTSRQEPEIQFQVTSDVTRTDSTKDLIPCSSQLKENSKRAITMFHEDDEECGIKNQQDSTIDQWEEEDKTFVMTETVLSILTHLEKINDVLITGPTGIGKSVILRHIALEYKNKHGYSVVICDNPSELENLYSKDTKQIFVIDDICGKNTVNKKEMHIWEHNKTRLLLKGNVKILASCNDQIFGNQTFQRSSSLTKNSFHLTSAIHSLSTEQELQIARIYLQRSLTQ